MTHYYLFGGTWYRIAAPSYHEAACEIRQAFGAFVVGNMSRRLPAGVDALPCPAGRIVTG
jgi:hypothetical protein